MEKTKLLTFTGTVLKNLFHKPATTGYPFEPVTYPERMRGHVELTTENCIACGLCMRSCPPGAIKVEKAIGKWTINRFDCIQCGNCAHMCPKKCLHLVPGYTEPNTEKISDVYDIPIAPPKKKPAQAAGGAPKAKQQEKTAADVKEEPATETGGAPKAQQQEKTAADVKEEPATEAGEALKAQQQEKTAADVKKEPATEAKEQPEEPVTEIK